MPYGPESDGVDLRGKYNVRVEQEPGVTRFLIDDPARATDWNSRPEPAVRSRRLRLWEHIMNFLRCLGRR